MLVNPFDAADYRSLPGKHPMAERFEASHGSHVDYTYRWGLKSARLRDPPIAWAVRGNEDLGRTILLRETEGEECRM